MGAEVAGHAREFAVIVGGPSNTFNGYGHYEASTYHPEPAPADTTPAAIGKYLHGDPAHQVTGNPTATHDVYWANFIYSAVKLVELRGRVPEAISPAKGDILTFLLFLPPYWHESSGAGDFTGRQQLDWDASPYNQDKHANSPYVNAKPYNPSYRRQDQGTVKNPFTPPPTTSTTRTSPVFSSKDSDINHEILMRTTSELDDQGHLLTPDGGFVKRPHEPTSYLDAITDVPERICYGARRGDYPPVTGVPPLLGVNVKVLFVREVQQLYDYLTAGTWSGTRRLSLWELVDEEHMSRGDVDECTWAGQGLVMKGKPYPDWSAQPAVDRTAVKIRRLDYVGHSNHDSLFLQYGTMNNKGEEPDADVEVSKDDLAAKLSQSLFTDNARIYMWGCNLGQEMVDALVPLMKRPGSVRGCTGFTTFDNILDPLKPTNLPEPSDPVNNGWVTK